MARLTRADYRRLIEPDLWEFIERTEACYPPDTHRQDVAAQRRIYDAMAAAFRSARPAGVSASDHAIGPARLRHYRRKGGSCDAAVLYAHGGSLSLGGLESHDDVCAEICAATGLDVVAVDYRLAPEHGPDEALGDVAAALGWLRDRLARPAVAVGDSAGGYLVARLAWENRGKPGICGQLLIYPGLGFEDLGGSLDRHAHAPLLSREEVAGALGAVDAGDVPADLRIRALLPEGADVKRLAPTVAISAEFDPLADGARHYVEMIAQAGGRALWWQEDRLVHGHLRARHLAEGAAMAFDRVLRAIAILAAGRLPAADALG